MTQMLIATETFWTEIDGKDKLFIAGVTRVAADHPVVKGREKYFADAPARPDVEDATAEPGRRRRRVS